MIRRLMMVMMVSSWFTFAVAAEDKTETVILQTTSGEITLLLDTAKAPETVANFLRYVDEGFYDGTIFHRVIKNFMIQGGGLTQDLTRKPTHDPVQNEAKNGLKNVRGSIAMARTQAPHSATAQFFINHQDNLNLDYPGFDGWGYAVFGQVSQGMDVVDQIANVSTGYQAGRQNVPRQPIIITSAKRKPKE
ncbi:MAG: peptidylprolyl isomerase [Pseudomonadota bacterium]